MKSVFYIGMDVHKDSVRLAVLKGSGKETVYEATLKNDTGRIGKAIKRFSMQGKVLAGYEAGCMGYTLQRSLAKEGVECRVIPANRVPRLGSERIKTDARDAVLIARMIKNNEAESIYVPSTEDEAVRDLIRCREDLKADLHRSRQRLSKFLLRTGHIYDGEHKQWTQAHRAWLRSLELGEVNGVIFGQYYSQIVDLEDRIEQVEAKVVALAKSEAYSERIAALRCFKGIDYLTALALVCEVGDFRRFPTAAAFMAYLGLVPSEYSSGSKRRQGGITKTGNSHLRRLLIETSWQYRYRNPASAALKARRSGMDELVVCYADKAQRRLQTKFAKLVLRGKSPKTAIAATARELAGFIWGAMNEAYC